MPSLLTHEHHQSAEGRSSVPLSILAVNFDFLVQKVEVDAKLQNIASPNFRPVIRVFGSTDVGQRACMYVHGVYPYIFFRPEVPNHPVFDSSQKLERLLPILENGLEQILQSKNRYGGSGAAKNSFSKRKRIYRLEVVSNHSIYGMWMDPMLFVKASLFDPRDITSLASVLDEGPLAGIQMQSYESHIPYLLQFTSTFNISPMGWIFVNNAKFRPPLPCITEIETSSIKGEENNSSSSQLMKGENLEEDFKTPVSASSSQSETIVRKFSQHGCNTNERSNISISTVDPHQVWTRKELGLPEDKVIESAIKNDSSILSTEQQLLPEELQEIQQLLEGINPNDLLPTQQQCSTNNNSSIDNINSIAHSTTLQQPSKPLPRKFVHPLEKASTCVLEFDVHASHILNINMPQKEFGAELWEEERIRCSSKGMVLEKIPIPPFTQTVHRKPSDQESEFIRRFQKLQLKGLSLKKQAQKKFQEISKAKVPKPKLAEDILLSQFIQTNTNIGLIRTKSISTVSNLESSSFELPVPVQFDADSWADETIQETIKIAEIQEESLELFIGQSDSIVDEYVRTQSSQQDIQQTPSHSSGIKSHSTRKIGILSAEKDDEDESEEIMQEDISQQEVQDILRSTQVEVHESLLENLATKSSSASQSINSLLNSNGIAMHPFATFDTVNLLDGSPSPLKAPLAARVAYFDSPALQSNHLFRSDSDIATSQQVKEFPPKQIDSAVGKEFKLLHDNYLSVTQPSTLPPSGLSSSSGLSNSRRLRFSQNQNQLASAFRKRKRDETIINVSSQGCESSPYIPIEPFHNYIAISSQTKEESIDNNQSSSKKLKRKSVSFAVPTNFAIIESTDDSNYSPAITKKKLWPTDDSDEFGSKLNENSTQQEFKEAIIGSNTINLNSSPLLYDVGPSRHDSRVKPSVSLIVEGISKSLRLVPSFLPPAFQNVAEIGLNDSDLLPHVVNTPAFFSNRKDAAIHKQSAQQSNQSLDYHAYMMERHDVKHQSDVELFFHVSETSKYDNCTGISDRIRCLIPTFTPPKFSVVIGEESENNILQGPLECKLASSAKKKARKSWVKSQITTPTQTPGKSPQHSNSADSRTKNKLGMGGKSKEKMTRLITLSMELICCTRKDLLPNPKYDAVQILSWCATDVMNNAEAEIINRIHGILTCIPTKSNELMVNNEKNTTEIDWPALKRQWQVNLASCPVLPPDIQMEFFRSEEDLYERFFEITKELDPDFLVGYEIQNQSFGYFIKRGVVIGKDALRHLSRLPTEKPSFRNSSVFLLPQPPTAHKASEEKEEDGDLEHGKNDDDNRMHQQPVEDNDDTVEDGDAGIFIKGRTILNNWQLMKGELKLSKSSIQYVAEEILKVSFPYFSCAQLTRWFLSPLSRYRTVEHVYMLSAMNILLLEKLDLIRKISESARLYGIDFYSVINRGSQYRVEAALLRRARAMNFLLLSPSRQKVANQSPMEVIPLVMEPQSRFYHDPVLVLDFQSLYPSMMITHNLCFSTCMGKLRPGVTVDADTTGKLGVITYPEKISALSSIHHLQMNDLFGQSSSTSSAATTAAAEEISFDPNSPYVSPNGSVFCAKTVRQGILPLMLKEMLNTRVMVKRAMKRHVSSEQSVLGKVLDARQLAIKLLANVTYGYTAAGFSGRMPMAELADAIVQSGRSLLEWTMDRIRTHPRWKAEVVYGDTDSIFVHLPGRSLQQAFEIGEEIARDITNKTPEDVVLKFEKVYYPSILVTKKRYVGNSYEHIDQSEPHLDAKGIEMIRRDQCPAAQKIQEKVLRLLFSTRDLSLVKEYLHTQWTKMLVGSDKLLMRDFIFWKEVRFGHYASVSSQPPGAIVATKAVLIDEMAVPPYNWRVPYVVVHGVPNAQLKQLVFDPKEVLRRGSNLRVNYVYYITKCINPALDRVLSLCGVNIFQWYRALVRPKPRIRHINYDLFSSDNGTVQKMIDLVDISVPMTGMHRYRQQQHHLLQGGAEEKKRRHQTTMDQFTMQATCEICEQDALPQKNLCQKCLSNGLDSLILLTQRLNIAQEQDTMWAKRCHACVGHRQEPQLFAKGEMIATDACNALECAVFHERTRLIIRMEDFSLAMRDIEQHDY